MNSKSSPFRRLHLLQDVGPLDQEILQEQATALGRLGHALEQALVALREFDEAHDPESLRSDSLGAESLGAESLGAESFGAESFGAESFGEPLGPLAAERAALRAALRDRAGHALWQFVIQREACGLRDAGQLMRDYRVPAEVQARMGAMPAGPTSRP